jgi:pullulanase
VIAKLRCLTWLALVWVPGLTVAQIDEQLARLPPLCTKPAASLTTVPEVASARIAQTPQALFLDTHLLHWTGQNDSTLRYVLVHSQGSALQIDPSGKVIGATMQVELERREAISDDSLREKFKWLEAGLVFAIDPVQVNAEKLKALLRGQLWLAALDSEQKLVRATPIQTAQALDALYASAADPAQPLGPYLYKKSSQLSVWAPTANRVWACLYAAGSRPEAVQLFELDVNQKTGVWSKTWPVPLNGSLYSFLVDVHVPSLGRVINRVTDPYSTTLTADSIDSALVDLNDNSSKPVNWQYAKIARPLTRPSQMVVYELHVRDFSANDNSVPLPARGKYAAFTYPNSAGMQHLKKLARAGITDIHLLPIFDFATVPEVGCQKVVIDLNQVNKDPASQQPQAALAANKQNDCFNWGYDPLHFGAPEGSYASDAQDPIKRVKELRSLILALKKTGLRVGMDVVYNHTSASGQARHSILDKIVPGYYQRLNSKGELETSTCCANTATEHRMMARLMRDTMQSWVDHYAIDSFRFDLMGHQPAQLMIDLAAQFKAQGKQIHFIGEGWNFGEVANGQRFVQAAQGRLNGTQIGTFSDRARDAMRGGGCCDSGKDALERKGFINFTEWQNQRAEALRLASLVRLGLAGTLKQVSIVNSQGQLVKGEQIDYAGQAAGYVTDVADVVNYVENHDNQTLFDINVFKLPRDTTPMDRARVQVLALAVPALSFGVAYFHAGGELLRSKSLDRNSYDSGDWFNRIDWSGRQNYYAAGLPMKSDNASDWPIMAQLLRDRRIRVQAKHIAWTRDQFFQLLALRKSLMPNAAAAQATQRALNELTFLNTGEDQLPGLIVARLYDPTLKREAMYAINTRAQSQKMTLPLSEPASWRVHPAVKGKWISAIYNRQLVIPARSWAAWVN